MGVGALNAVAQTNFSEMEWFSAFYIAGGDAVHFRILMNKMAVMTLVAPDTRHRSRTPEW
jgi:hypothetical protein